MRVFPTFFGAAVALATCQALTAATASFDFESETATSVPRVGAYTSLSMTDNGLTITLTRSTGAAFDIVDNTAGDQTGKPASWGDQSLDPFFVTPESDTFIANFSSPISTFSIQFGDYGGDSDTPVTLSAYSGAGGSGSLLGTASETWADTDLFPEFKGLTVVSPGINSVVFGSIPTGSFPNSMFWDNISIRFEEETSVPDAGGTALLLSLTAAGLFRFRRTA